MCTRSSRAQGAKDGQNAIKKRRRFVLEITMTAYDLVPRGQLLWHGHGRERYRLHDGRRRRSRLAPRLPDSSTKR